MGVEGASKVSTEAHVPGRVSTSVKGFGGQQWSQCCLRNRKRPGRMLSAGHGGGEGRAKQEALGRSWDGVLG